MNKLIKFKLEDFDYIYILNGLLWTTVFAIGFIDTSGFDVFKSTLGIFVIFVGSHYAIKLVRLDVWKHI